MMERIAVIFASIAVLAMVSPCRAAEPPAGGGLERYAVKILRGPAIDGAYVRKGAGIYIGHGLILTASHVAGEPSSGAVLLAGFGFGNLVALYVKQGSYAGVDATLLSVDSTQFPGEVRTLPPLSLCDKDPVPGQDVVVVGPDGNVSRSHIVSPMVLDGLVAPDVAVKLTTLIGDVDTTGNSGTGVFDAGTHCLMGIMSRRIDRVYTSFAGLEPKKTIEGVAKYFVSARLMRSYFGSLLKPDEP
jgi:hypothetical protein